MKYMLMLYEPNTDWESVPRERLEQALSEHERFVDYLRQRGRPFSGEALRPSTSATTLRSVGGETIVSNGPFVELTEHIAGYYLIEADNLDEAIEVARRCPVATGIEVRSVWEPNAG